MIIEGHRLQTSGEQVSDVEVIHHESPNQYGEMDSIWCQLHHYIDSRDAEEPIDWFLRTDSNASAHLYVMRDRFIHQFVDFNCGAWHSGEAQLDGRSDRYGSINLCSIGLEFEGNGQLVRDKGVWRREWSNREYNIDRVIDCRHQLGGVACGWTTFTEWQVRMAMQLSQLLSVYSPIIKGHYDVSWPRKVDPGPLWPIEAIRRASA